MAIFPVQRRIPAFAVLLILLLFSVPLFAQIAVRPGDTPLVMRAYNALRDGDYKLAAELLGKHLESQPNSWASWYNYTCALSRAGEDSAALAALDCARQAGFVLADFAASDPDLEPLHRYDQFNEILDEAREQATENAKHHREVRWLTEERLGRYQLCLPDDYDEKSSIPLPVVMFLHGGSGDLNEGMRFVERMNPEGFAVILIEGPYRSNDGLGFDQYVNAIDETMTVDGRPLQPTSHEMNTLWLRRVLDDAATAARLDRKHVFIVGFSQGAFQTLYTLARDPDTYCAAGIMGGRIPESVNDARQFVAYGKRKGKVLILQGELDRVGDPQALKKVFDEAEIHSELILYPNQNHLVTDQMISDFADWAVKLAK